MKTNSKKQAALSRERLRELLTYAQETGEFRYNVRRGGQSAGDVAGRVDGNGYVTIRINQVCYLAHRLAWFYIHNEWPAEQIDHINGNKTDNRIENLRAVSQTQNLYNLPIDNSRNSTGFQGVRQNRNGRFSARLRSGRKYTALGTFDTAEEAHAAYVTARDRKLAAIPPIGGRHV